MDGTARHPSVGITLATDGVHVTSDEAPEVVLPWDEIVEVSVSAYDVAGATERSLAFDHVSGHVVELGERVDGWAEAVAGVGRHLPPVVDDPLAVAHSVGPADDPVVIARPT